MATRDTIQEFEEIIRREVITGSAHARQAQTKTQDLDDVGSEFGSTRMSFETLDSQIAKRSHEDHESILNSKRKVQVAEGFQEENISRC